MLAGWHAGTQEMQPPLWNPRTADPFVAYQVVCVPGLVEGKTLTSKSPDLSIQGPPQYLP
jgi:hypothetical protein